MYTERHQLLDDIAEMWREKEVEKEQEKGAKANAKAIEIERKNAGLAMRAAALNRFKNKNNSCSGGNWATNAHRF